MHSRKAFRKQTRQSLSRYKQASTSRSRARQRNKPYRKPYISTRPSFKRTIQAYKAARTTRTVLKSASRFAARNPSSIAYLALAGGLAWLFWKFKPLIQTMTGTNSPAPSYAFTGGNDLIAQEQQWEVPYLRVPESLRSLTGSKKWTSPSPLGAFGPSLKPLTTSDPWGIIRQLAAPTTDKRRGQNGNWLPPAALTLTYTPGNRPDQHSFSLNGDVRALYCLSVLCREAELNELHHLGLAVWNLATADYGHDLGYAIDLTNDDEMNALVNAATSLKMPIGWISRSKITDAKGKSYWPKFQLRNGVKTRVGSSTINHNSHFHLMLPRPDAALIYVQRNY